MIPGIAASEKSTGFRNYALVYYMKALGKYQERCGTYSGFLFSPMLPGNVL
jgi:glutaminase